jgi:hypothetical protein
MEEAPENGKESSHSAHANGIGMKHANGIGMKHVIGRLLFVVNLE